MSSLAETILAPLVTGTGQGSRSWQRLAGSTSQSSTELDQGTYHTIQNDTGTPIRVRWTATSDTAVTTDWCIGPYGRLDWLVDGDTKFVNVIGDASAAFECHVAATCLRGA